MVSYKTIGFKDDTVKGKEFGDKPEMFKIEAGRKDCIRILTPPVMHYTHSIPLIAKNGKETIFWQNCLCDLATSDKGDPAEMAAQCPACKAGHVSKDRYIMMIVWLWSEKSGRQTRREQTLAWSIHAARYENIRELAKTLPDGVEITSKDIWVIGEGTMYQKAVLMLAGQDSKIPADVIKDIQTQHLNPDKSISISDPAKWLSLVDLLEVESVRDCAAGLARALASFGPAGQPAPDQLASGTISNQTDPLDVLKTDQSAQQTQTVVNDDRPEAAGDELNALLGNM